MTKIEFESGDVEVSLDTECGQTLLISNKHTEGIESIHLTDPDAIRLIMNGLRLEKNALELKKCVLCSHPDHAYQCMADDEDGMDGQCDCGASKYRKNEPEDFTGN